MTRRERTLLLAGLLSGALVVVFMFAVQEHVLPHQQPVTAAAADNAAAEPAPPRESSNKDSSPSVQLTEQEQKAIGVETVAVQRQTVKKEIIASGKVTEPETGIGAISARIGGRLEKLFVNVTGETVARGQAVALIYSPEVFAAGEEYRLAIENRQRLGGSKESQAINDADDLVRASRRRLELWGVSSAQIDDMAVTAGKAVQITTYSPLSGIVTKRNVAEGQYVKEGDVLFELADLSTVWVGADIFESDIPFIHPGQKVKITAPTLAGGSTQGTVGFLQPSVDPQNRTMTARIQVSNPQMRLRPGMFVQAALQAPVGTDVVAVPRSAVLDTGKEKVVYVARENGIFEKRAIEADAAGDDYYAATRGIQAGERVVTHGSFLIDSQTRLSGTITGMFGGSKAYGTDDKVTLRFEPDPPRAGSELTVHAIVTGSDGKPVADAQVQATLIMPAMPSMGMPETRLTTNLKWNGSEYTGKSTPEMAGSWNVIAEARRGSQLLAVYKTRFEAR